ncbi:hypothetical protein [Microcoleus sp. F4-D5]|uniref:hypothetical protein n=1 Tax=Microcoleus sp. F4-D5 TaxID=2818760 RepID=UPI002FD619DB
MLGRIELGSPNIKKHRQSLGNKSLTKTKNLQTKSSAITDILAKKGCSRNSRTDAIAQQKTTEPSTAPQKVSSKGSPPTYHP